MQAKIREAFLSVFNFDNTGFEISGRLLLPSVAHGLKNLGSQAPTRVVVENTSNRSEYSKPRSSSFHQSINALKNVKSPRRYHDVSTAHMQQDISHPQGVAILSTALLIRC